LKNSNSLNVRAYAFTIISKRARPFALPQKVPFLEQMYVLEKGSRDAKATRDADFLCRL
jgi:hypothetical protein